MSSDSEHYTLHVNGIRCEVTDSWLGESLLDVLRDRLGLMGTKGACTQGECGSCSVLVDDRPFRSATGFEFRPDGGAQGHGFDHFGQR